MTQSNFTRIVILGGGPTGLSTAYHLEQNGFFDYVLYEKEETTGGLCRSIKDNGFTYDYTGHLLHINDSYFKSFINSITDLSQFNSINRQSFIFSNDIYTKYPFQSNLYGLPTKVIAECIEGFIKRKKNNLSPQSFHQWVLKNFGQGFGKHFFFDYQEKIFSYDIKKITASWTGRFVPQTNLERIIEGALNKNTEEVGYNAQFYYPKQGGIQFWLDKLREKLHNQPQCGFEAQSIDPVKKVVTFSNGHQQQYDQLISTMPLDEIIKKTKEPPHSFIKTAISKLKCNSVVNINLGIEREKLTDKHWIYFPEKKYPFYRLGFYHNFASSMTPKKCSSVYAEFSYIKKINNKHEIITESIKAIKKLFSITENEIINEKIVSISHAYVIYNKWRDTNIVNVLNHLETFDIQSIGRYGAWKYASMQEAILDGKKAAEKILEISNETSLQKRNSQLVLRS